MGKNYGLGYLIGRKMKERETPPRSKSHFDRVVAIVVPSITPFSPFFSSSPLLPPPPFPLDSDNFKAAPDPFLGGRVRGERISFAERENQFRGQATLTETDSDSDGFEMIFSLSHYHNICDNQAARLLTTPSPLPHT